MGQNIEPLNVVATNCILIVIQNTTHICDKNESKLLKTNNNAFSYPVVIISMEEIMSRGRSLLFFLCRYKKPIRTESKRTETLLMKKVPVYLVE